MSAINSPTGMNLATALMVMAHASQPDAAREALIKQRGWVKHWIDDVNGGLAPTPESLSAALSNIERVLDALSKAG